MDGTIGMKDGKVTLKEHEPIPEPLVMPEGIPTPDPNKPETIPANLFGMGVQRLETHGDKPGFRRRWFNDDGDNMPLAVKSGWTFVERTDVQLNAAVTPRNVDVGSKVAQWVGTDARGQPMYAYLMEKPLWLDELHSIGPGSREDYHRKIEQQIQSGTLSESPAEKRYSAARPYPGTTNTLPPISTNTKLVR